MALHFKGHVKEEVADDFEHGDNKVISPHSGHSSNSDQNIKMPSLGGRSFRAYFSSSAPFLPSWGLTTASNLNNVKSCHDMMHNLATPAIRTHKNCLTNRQAFEQAWVELDCRTLTQSNLLQCLYLHEDLSEDHKALQQTHLGCVGKEATVSEQLGAVEKGKEDLLDKNKSQEERIKELDETFVAKSAALTEAEHVTSLTKKDLEQLTMDLSQADIVKHNYVRQLLPTVVKRLLSSAKYKKSLSKPFNLAIATGWSKGVKVDRID
uniref:Uncharacterized protein n=1 Tax=Tanacetum cinerariifolium TaxID=118510 RepID=A0A6L2NXF7_TANCI|nr:hypothetical protein [Tanacetum cinerariifolium]